MLFPRPDHRCDLDPRTLRTLPSHGVYQGADIAVAQVQDLVQPLLRGDVSVTRDGRTWYPWRGVEPVALDVDGTPLAPMSRTDLELLGWSDAGLLQSAAVLGCTAPNCGPPGPNVARRWMFVVVMRHAMTPT